MSTAPAMQGRIGGSPSSGKSTELSDVEHSQWWLVWHNFRKHRLGVVGLATLISMALAAIFIPLFFPNPYNGVNPDATLWAAPMGKVDPANGHVFWLGGDKIGRDNLALLFEGGRLSLIIALVPAVIVLVIGFIIGAVSGYYGGWLDSVLMRIADFMLALPLLPAYLMAIRLIRVNPRSAPITSDTAGIVATLITVLVL
ncbi:MAG TPA: hypothetical protein VM409_01285, partial [Chloroflexia bacterium]|nr:hypothetical protein [Chloroflexia bacterium]